MRIELIAPCHFGLESVLKREIPLKAHAHAAEDIFTALRIAKSLI